MSSPGAVLKILRLTHGYTVDELAGMLEMSKGYLSELENDKKIPGKKAIEKYAKTFKTKPYVIYALIGKAEDQTFVAKVRSQVVDSTMKIMERLALDEEHNLSN